MRVTVYRGIHEPDGARVVLKRLERPRDGSNDAARFRREFEIARRVGGEGIVPVLELEESRQGPTVVMADFGGVSVALERRARPPTLAETLRIGAAVALALGRVHAGHVIHKDVNPSNIVWNRAAGTVYLIDFSIAAELARETSSSDTDQLEGTLPYLAPEQTGRMNRSVDWRSDFYALGATLYDLLIGRPPFEGDDALAVIHGHIARTPTPPHLLDPAIPPMVSEVVLKLLAKDPEQRYQSAQGIITDLETCLAGLDSPGGLTGFPLAAGDFSPRFHIPETLYGREADIARLLQTFEQVAGGGARLLLVTGPPGIGKSALVHEVRKPLTARRGHFLQGKYDQFKRNIPYSGLVQAFGALARRLLAEPEAALEERRQALSRAIGANGSVVTSLIPEFALILGPQPPMPAMPPADAEFRFQLTFQNLVVALATATQPLVLVLDDLQWADRSSLALLGKLISDPEMHHLLVIGTCRSEEIDGHVGMVKAVESMAQAGGTITVGPLALADVRALIADTTRRDDDDVSDLAAVCDAKTEGNPFFLIQFLQSLHEDGLITLDRAAGRWNWDTAAILGRDSTDNVVDLMVGKIRRLAPGTARALSLAACVGGGFDLATLAVAAGEDAGRLAADLWPALGDGLIVPLDANYRYLIPPADGEPAPVIDGAAVRCRFLHDRVQQAAYSLIPERERAGAHLRIGRLLLAQSQGAERAERLFDIADQFNRGRALITDSAERRSVAGLDLEVARRAKASAAFEAALAYAQAGIALLGEDGWRDDYETTLALRLIAAEAATLVDDVAAMESHALAVLRAARDPVDAAQVQMIRLTAAAGRGDPASATRIGLEALAALGVSLPHAPGALRQRLEVWRGRWALSRARFGLMSGADDDEAAAIRRATTARVLMAMVATTIISARHLLVPVAVRLLEQALPSRDPGISSFAYLSWALIRAVNGDPESAVTNGRRALDLLDDDALRGRYVRVILIANYCGLHWAEPPTPLRERYLDIHHLALGAGDREYAVYGLAFRLRTAWQTGLPLTRLKADLDEGARVLDRLGTTPYTTYVAGLRQAVANLESTKGEASSRLEGDHFHEGQALPALREADNRIVLANLLSVKLALAVVFGDIETARGLIREIEELEYFLRGYSTQPVVKFLTAMVDTAGPLPNRAARLVAAGRLVPVIRWFRACAATGPANQRHRLLLLRAESLRLRGRINAATQRYEQAATAAAESGHVHEEALADERAAAFHRECGHGTLERAYRTQARDAYRRWGAWAKVKELDRLHPELAPAPRAADTTTRTVSTTTDRFGTGVLDFSAVLKAAQAISGEIRLDALVETMLRTVLHSAGAERGLLLLPKSDQSLVLVAEGDIGSGRFSPLADLPPESPGEDGLPRLPLSIVSFAVRSGEAVVLADAAADPRFVEDPHIARRRPKSVLCLPLVRQGQLVGVLYLENNLTTDAFSGGRLEAPRLLAAQIAISLENARLYDELSDFNRALEAQVAERTRDLRAALASERAAHDELRAAQKQLVQAEKMASLGQLVAGMAHEINTPIGNALTGITFLADATTRIKETASKGNIRRSDFSGYLASVTETTEITFANINRAVDLVESFKTVAADRARDERRPFDLKPYLKEVLLSLEPTWRRAGHAIALDCRDDLELDGYPGGIAQIITNLVINSVTHAYPGDRTGTLRITVTEPAPDTVMIDYADDGRGIAPENRDRVFDPFFTTRRGGGSTGLGLHIIFNLVTSKLGGRIELAPLPGPGTRFVVTLPKQAPGPEADAVKGR